METLNNTARVTFSAKLLENDEISRKKLMEMIRAEKPGTEVFFSIRGYFERFLFTIELPLDWIHGNDFVESLFVLCHSMSYKKLVGHYNDDNTGDLIAARVEEKVPFHKIRCEVSGSDAFDFETLYKKCKESLSEKQKGGSIETRKGLYEAGEVGTIEAMARYINSNPGRVSEKDLDVVISALIDGLPLVDNAGRIIK